MAIVRIGKGSFCRLERPRAFEILKADSSYYKVVGTFDVAQRTLSKLMAIYRNKMFCQIRAAKIKRQHRFILVIIKKKNEVHPLKKKIVISCATILQWSDDYIFSWGHATILQRSLEDIFT